MGKIDTILAQVMFKDTEAKELEIELIYADENNAENNERYVHIQTKDMRMVMTLREYLEWSTGIMAAWEQLKINKLQNNDIQALP